MIRKPANAKRIGLPIAGASRHAVREKSIRHAHPNTLHFVVMHRRWLRVGRCLMALLLPDPCDAHYPAAFKRAERGVLRRYVGGRSWSQVIETDDEAHFAKVIADFANRDAVAHPAWIKNSRTIVKAAQGQEAPLVVDRKAPDRPVSSGQTLAPPTLAGAHPLLDGSRVRRRATRLNRTPLAEVAGGR